MSERLWAWIIWLGCPFAIALLAFYTFGAGLALFIPWWWGGPFHYDKESMTWAPFWDPPRPRKLWWREIR